MEKKQLNLRTLWQRGCSDLWQLDNKRKGVIFNCWEVIISQTVSRFLAHGKKENFDLKCNIGDTSIFRWEVFVPFGETTILEWYNQYGVVVLSTEAGPLELASEWFGGGADYYQAWAIMPDGKEIEVEGDKLPIDFKEIASAWQKCRVEVVATNRTGATVAILP